MKQDPKLELKEIFLYDVAEIFASRVKSKIIHGTNDIKASGDEVEIAVRKFFSLKLPKSYYVGHGHLVDYRWFISPQIDLVVANNNISPFLFKAANGTEYFPVESVYAICEVKSTYYKSENYIGKFIKTISDINQNFRRKSIELKGRCLNRLLYFMIFVDSNDLKIDFNAKSGLKIDFEDKLFSYKLNEFPGMICFLDKGIFTNVTYYLDGKGEERPMGINLYPEIDYKEAINHWTFIKSEKERDSWRNLAFLYYFLMEHLNSCSLAKPSMMSYFLEIFFENNYYPLDESKLS